jgi:hypothetical protein
MGRIVVSDSNLPVDRIVRVLDLDVVPREPFACVTRYSSEDPACPFCGGRSFD